MMANFAPAGFSFPAPSMTRSQISDRHSYSGFQSYNVLTQISPTNTRSPLILFPSPTISNIGRPLLKHDTETVYESCMLDEPLNTSSNVDSTMLPFGTSSQSRNNNTAVDGFSEALSNVCDSTENRACKRKAQTYENFPPNKVFVSEQYMADSMQRLHLDNNNLAWHPDFELTPNAASMPPAAVATAASSLPGLKGAQTTPLPDGMLTDDFSSDDEDPSAIAEGDGLRRLKLSKTLQMGLRKKDILPKDIIQKIAGNNMQLVLWKPPGESVLDMIRGDEQASAAVEAPVVEADCARKKAPFPDNRLPFVWPSFALTPTQGSNTEDECMSAATTVQQMFDSFDDDMEL